MKNFLLILSLLLLPMQKAMAQDNNDTVYTFRFVPQKDMFYVPMHNNEQELDRLTECIDSHLADILSGSVPIYVDGYCNSMDSRAENMSTAAIRSNRVKSELIVRNNIKEECFVTANHDSGGDYVTVRIRIEGRKTEAPAEKAVSTTDEKTANRPDETENSLNPTGGDITGSNEAQNAEQSLTSQKDNTEKEYCAWYAGLKGGVAFGISQLSSFGADKTRAGWSAGVYGGYRFNAVLSLEAQAAWASVNLSLRDCCPDYWLGSDAVRYEAAVAGMQGWNYSSLRSRAFVQSYGLQLNVNLLGFFTATRHSRWTLELAPRIAAIGTEATFYTISDGNEVMKGDTQWHFGAGGNIQAAYSITDNLNLGIFTGITYITGKPVDGMPEHLHKTNYIWESGIRLGWFFHK